MHHSSSSSSPTPTPPPLEKERRRKFDVATKLELAREAQATSLNAVSKKYDVARQNLRLWIRTYAQLERRAQEQQGDDRGRLYRLHGAGRRVSCSQLDQALARRVTEQFANGAAVTRRLLQEWALELKETLQSDAAVVPTWISRFMRRHGVSTTSSGAVVPTDPSAPDQQRRKRAVVSNEDKLAITHFFESSNRDIEKTLLEFYGPITDPKVRQVKVRSIYHWLQNRDEIAQRVHDARLQHVTERTDAADPSTRSAAAAVQLHNGDGDASGEKCEEDMDGEDPGEDEGGGVTRSGRVDQDDVRADGMLLDNQRSPVVPGTDSHEIYVPSRHRRAVKRRVSSDHHCWESESSDLELALDRRRREVLARQETLREQKEWLLVESMRCSNALKRIQVAEENILARKRLRDAGVAQHEIDELMPLVGFSAADLGG